MTVSIKRMSAGDGYRYLMRSVATGDVAHGASTSLTRYYTQTGNPPGVWMGAGLAGRAGSGPVSGSSASELQMFRLFGMGQDPTSGASLGVRPYRCEANGRQSVAGFDLTFSVPKSVSVLWALADARTQQAVVDAHHGALSSCLRLLEKNVAATRTGKNGVAQLDVRGLIAAGFDHWDSRAGDPHLHTHLVIANRVQTADGAWRTLDSRALYRSVVAVSEVYHGLLADELTRSLGVTWDQRPRRHSAVPAWEVAGIPDDLIALFSQRSQAIEADKNRLAAEFREGHGRDPSSVEMLRLRQQATLRTRPAKQLHSLAESNRRWREQASAALGTDAAAWITQRSRSVPAFAQFNGLDSAASEMVARTVLQVVSDKRSVWGWWNLHAEASRQLMGYRFTTFADRLAATDRVAELVAAQSVLLSAPALARTPEALVRSDGTSAFTHRRSEKYTSRALLDAEARLLDAAEERVAPRVDANRVVESLASPPPGCRYRLGADQADAVRSIATSGRTLDVLVGPAGTGKTVTLAGLRATWEQQHGPGSVIGLAPSSSAAEILAHELGVPTENTAKWLFETQRNAARTAEIAQCATLLRRIGTRNPRLAQTVARRRDELTSETARWQLRPGQLVILDEASLAGTVTLDRLAAQAKVAGVKILLSGDWAQLGAVDAGGAFRLLATARDDAPELGAIRRFTNRWERDASRRLRTGDAGVLPQYAHHDRLRDGDDDSMLDAAYAAWLSDERAGIRSLLIAADTATVTALNTRARSDLVATGTVQPDGVPLTAGTQAGIGDRILTRKNERLLTTGAGYVKNGDHWTVVDRSADGSLVVHRPRGGPLITLPAAYVASHVDLAYAATAHRCQGATVDTAHTVVTTASTRETFYVAMTRGRHRNTAYVVTDHFSDDCEPDSTSTPSAVRDVLTAVLHRVGADASAHDTMRAEQHTAASIWQLAAEYDAIAAHAQAPRWTAMFEAARFTSAQVQSINDSPAYGALSTALRSADSPEVPIERVFSDLVNARDLTNASDLAAVLHDRVTLYSATRRAQPDRRVVGLIPRVHSVQESDTATALGEREILIRDRAAAVLDQAISDREPWTAQLGPRPTEPARRETWTRAAITVAAFHDRYPNGSPDAPSRDDDAALQRALAVVGVLSTTSTRPTLRGADAPEPIVRL